MRIFRGAVEAAAVPPGDRGLAYGDGVFETLRAHRGDLPWWSVHWARLSLGASRLGIPLPEEGLVREAASTLFEDRGDGVLKLLLTRGAGARGYAPLADAMPTWIVSRHALPAPPRRGLSLHWCDLRLSPQPLLAGIKHCNRLEQVLARAECERAGVDEGLLRDGDGNVVSATAANLFVLREGGWQTPPVDRCGVAGTCRAALLGPLAAREATLAPGDVEAADAVFLCNAVRGILPVARLGARGWPPHPAVARAQSLLARLHSGFSLDDSALDDPDT